MVFSDQTLREFIFSLQTQFFSQFAEFNVHWDELLGNIASSLTHSPMTAEHNVSPSLIPEDITSRLYSRDKMQSILRGNSWLVIFILIALWGRFLTYEELRA